MSDKTEFTITTNRFRELIDNEKYKNIPRAEIAKATDCDTSTITKYYNGQRQLSVDSIIKFAKYFNVSSDYLLGLTNTPTVLNSSDEKALRICCDYIGLDKKAVNSLRERKNRIVRKNYYSHFENYLFYTDNEYLLSYYLNLMNETVNEFISSECFEDIIKTLVSESLLSIGLKFTEYICSGNVKNNELDKMNIFEISHCFETLIEQNRDIQKKHRLNLFDLQDYITDFCKKISDVDNYELFGDIQFKTTLIEFFLSDFKKKNSDDDFIDELNKYMSKNNEQ